LQLAGRAGILRAEAKPLGRPLKVYFDLRLFALTRGVRSRILLAALVGLAGLPVSLGRLALSGVVIEGGDQQPHRGRDEG
jgi:hypothetical protein